MQRQRSGAAVTAALRANWRPIIRWTPILLCAALMAFAIARTAPFALFDRFSADVRISWLGPTVEMRDDIVLIAITDETLAQFPFQAPINRSFLASLTSDLDARKARVIAFDILLDTATVDSDDRALRDAFADADAEIVLVDFPIGRNACARDDRPSQAEPVVLPMFDDVATLGDGALCEDQASGVVRAVTRSHPQDGFAAKIVRAAAGEASIKSRLADIRFTLTKDSRWPFPTYAAHHVAHLPSEWFEDRIVIVGAVTPFADRHVTPLRLASVEPPAGLSSGLAPSDTLPGVLAHTYAVAQQLDGADAPRLVAWREAVLALMAAIIGVMLGGGAGRWWIKAGLLVAAPIFYGASVFALFAVGGPLLGLSSFSAGVLIAGGVTVAVGEQRQRRQSAHVKRAFEHYLAPDIVDEMVRNPEALTLAAHERDISVLISDIENFARFIDQHDRAAVADVINTYLDRMIAIVLAHGGAVDKIVGDSVHALFSAPVEDPEHRRNAVQCAVAMNTAAKEVEADFAARGLGLGRTRVGVHSGVALVGNFGGAKRFDYTAHGSTINIAARLEAANKIFGTAACVSGVTRVEAADILYRTVGEVLLRGFDRSIAVFEPVAAGEGVRAFVERYEAALSSGGSRPDHALAELEALEREAPDGLIRYQLARARAGQLGSMIAL